MLDKLKEYPQYFQFYDIEDLKINKEHFLLGEGSLSIIEKQWLHYLNPTSEQWEHPNSLMDYIPCHISDIKNFHLDVTLLIDRSNRFHTITKSLPKQFFKAAFLPHTSESRPSLIVDQTWFENLFKSIYSAYVLIDFIGIRNILNEYGEFPIDRLEKIKSIIDELCIEHPEIICLTCADNIIMKSSWNPSENKSNYQPETLLSIVDMLMARIEKEVGLKSYAIFTQGANYVNEQLLSSKPSPPNHLFISSISIPFIEAFEIDSDIRKRIKDKEIQPMPIYIEYSFYISMSRKYMSGKEPQWFKRISFKTEKLKTQLTYSALTFDRLCELIEMSQIESSVDFLQAK